jgi:hypothetical protein
LSTGMKIHIGQRVHCQISVVFLLRFSDPSMLAFLIVGPMIEIKQTFMMPDDFRRKTALAGENCGLLQECGAGRSFIILGKSINTVPDEWSQVYRNHSRFSDGV